MALQPLAPAAPVVRPAPTTTFDLVCFGQQDWDRTWTEKQQHCVRLARRGHRVLYVDFGTEERPAGARDALRAIAPARSGLGLDEVDGGVLRYRHHHAPLIGWRLNERRRPAALRAVVDRLGFRRPAVLAFRPDVLPLIEALEPGGVFYYAVDEMSAFGSPTPEQRARVRRQEEAVLRRTSAAFGVSPRLARRFAELQPNSHVLENGVEPDHFHPDRLARLPSLPEIAALPTPRIGLIGQIDERVDQALLLALARADRRWSLVLVGRVKDGVDVSALAAEPNVHLLGYRPYEDLPRVLRDLDVCLVPYHRTELTESCNPSKIYEYVAAGKPVVATPLDGIRICRPVVHLAEGPAAFVAAVREALAESPARRDERLALARESCWDRRTDVLEAVIAAALAGARPSVHPGPETAR